MSKFPVTVCIIAKNEEKFIEGCLTRLKQFGFEIIVADTGSTDRTVEISQKYADKVVHFEWINDFSAARNYCASFATNNWIIAIDCDEYMESMDLKVLRILMQKCSKMTGTIRLTNLTKDCNGDTSYGTDDVIRMYNKNLYHFVNAIHEQLCSIDPKHEEDILQCFLIPTKVVHHGYNLDKEEMDKKQERNLNLLKLELEKNPLDSYMNFQVGQSLMIIDKPEEAIKYFEVGMENQPGIERIFVQVMLISLAKSYIRTGREKEAVALMEKYESECKTAKFMYAYAGTYYEAKQYLKALIFYLKTTTCADVDTLGNDLLKSYEYIVSIYQAMGKPEMAEPFMGKLEQLRKNRDEFLNAVTN